MLYAALPEAFVAVLAGLALLGEPLLRTLWGL